MILSCPWCQKQLSVEETLAGKNVNCSGCGQVLLVPSPPAAAAAPGLASVLSPPQTGDELGRLGKYRILKALGRDGRVYQAEDSLLKRTVALKMLLRDSDASDSVRQRFFRESQLMAALTHDHVVRILEVGEEQGVPYLAMEFLHGELLDARLGREKKIPILEAVRIGKEIAEGLQAIHQRGLIHRDINPSNVWLQEPAARVKILGFALARSTEPQSGQPPQGAIAGTPAYLSPEQARGEAADVRSDLFSLGVILYRLGCGRLPFQGEDALATLQAVANEEPLPVVVVNPKLPAELSNLVTQLLQKKAERRPASAAVAAQTLQALEKKLLRARELKQQTPAPRSSSTWRDFLRQRRLVVALAAGLLAAAVVAGIVLFLKR